jgi:hypothetical protein
MVIPGRAITDPPGCVCGARIEPAAFASGVYEVRRSRRASRRRPREALPYGRGAGMGAGDAASLAQREPDLGYGESHGYGPAHGGPTGPADAPAPAPENPRESQETDDAA